MYERIPEKDTSIPFTTYGRGKKFLPLKIRTNISIKQHNKWRRKLKRR
jgi:hypothetical protein